jgi:hypothetical protein
VATSLKAGFPLSRRRKLLLAASIFLLSFVMKSLHAVDLAPLMHTVEQPAGGMTEEYNQRAFSILEGHGILIPDNVTAEQTGLLARPPGYPVYLSAIYLIFGKNYYAVQVIQNAFNSLSPILIFFIAGELFGWRVGTTSGLLAATSHHLSYYSNFILPDSLSALPTLFSVYLLVRAWGDKAAPYWKYALAGGMMGVASWLRPNLMMMGAFYLVLLPLLGKERRQVLKRAAVLMAFSMLIIAPITVRNYVIYGEFIPIQLGLGFSLWAGIAEAGGDRFGAVATDGDLVAQEAALYHDPRYSYFWAEPDGIMRDRDRVKRSLEVIQAHPFWYAGSILTRDKDMVKYSAQAPLVHRTTAPYGLSAQASNSSGGGTDSRDDVYSNRPSDASLIIGKSISFLRPMARAIQRVTKETALLFILIGALAAFSSGSRRATFLLIVPLYYFIVQGTMATEFRYTLPMHYFLFTFAAITWVIVFSAGKQAVTGWLLPRRKRVDFEALLKG